MTDYSFLVQKYCAPLKTITHVDDCFIEIKIFKDNKKISVTIFQTLAIPSSSSEFIASSPHLQNKTWDKIELRLKAILLVLLKDDSMNECFICSSDKEKNKVACPCCAQSWCNLCYIEMIRNNLSRRCSFCQFDFTGEIPTMISEI